MGLDMYLTKRRRTQQVAYGVLHLRFHRHSTCPRRRWSRYVAELLGARLRRLRGTGQAKPTPLDAEAVGLQPGGGSPAPLEY